MLIRDVITKILFVAKIVRDPTMYPHNDNVFTNSEIDKFRSIKLQGGKKKFRCIIYK